VLISIITPTYNSQETIKRTITSLNNQSICNFEHIVIDKFSNDETLKIIKNTSKYLVKIFKKEDKGIYHAMNLGILLAKGDYICFLNSDDWFNKNTVKIFLNYIKKNPDIDIFYGNGFLHSKKGILQKKIISNHHAILSNMSLLHPSILIKTKIIRRYMFNLNYKISADYFQLLSMYRDNRKFKHIDKNLSNISLGGYSSNFFLSSKEFYKIQRKFNTPIIALINFIKRYHYHIFKYLLFNKNSYV
jgi:glycosyltransferase involved in cell wall biosynthesis